MKKQTRIVDPKLKALFDQMPGAWGCKDENSVFMYANVEYGNIIGLPHADVIGRTDFDMPCDTVNCAELFRKQDQKVIESAERMRILDIHPFAGGEWKAYIFTKTPLRDENQQIIGTIFHGVNITNVSTLEIGSLLAQVAVEDVKNDLLGQSSYMIGSKFNSLPLTARQSEVLFYLLRGKSAKQIAIYLEISSRTVENYIEQLKAKFKAQNKFELIDLAISQGFLNSIPESLFRTQLSVELKD